MGYFLEYNPDMKGTKRTACSYGDPARANSGVLEYQVFQIIFTVSLAIVLFQNHNLHRFYKPLARIVDLTLILKVLSCVFYVSYYPYSEGEGNCAEIFTGRALKSFLAIGEMHQIYLLANVLGLAKQKVPVPILSRSLSLNTILNVMSIVVVVTIFLTYFYFEIFIRPLRHLWSMLVVAMQLRIVSVARSAPPSKRDHDIISTNDTAILLFERLSLMQIFPSLFLFLRRVLILCGVALFPPVNRIEGAVLIIGDVNSIIFYLKVLLVTLKANVSIYTDENSTV